VAGSSDRGLALVDVIAATALATIVTATAIPAVAGAMDRDRAEVGAQYLKAQVTRAQLEALRRGTCVALRWSLDGPEARWQAFADGNGNGVSERDIADGIDQAIGPEERLSQHASGVTLRINQAVPDIGGDGVVHAGSDPLRIGRTSLLSFSPTGSATSGTVYIAAPRGPQLALRVMGATGRVRLLRFDPGAGAWRP
jgi:hypothetical protein